MQTLVSDTTATVTDRLQRPLRDLRISVTDRCNFRCSYCMPADTFPQTYAFLHRADLLRFEEITEVARACVRLGVHKIRLTGGEPLLRKDLPALVRMLSEETGVGDIALTTNGVLLPRSAEALRKAGLKRITVSLDALNDSIFRAMSGVDIPVEAVLAGIAAAEAAGFHPLKINAVIRRGFNESEILPLVEHFRGTGHILRFIEYMDAGTCNHWRREEVVTGREIIEQIAHRYPLYPVEPQCFGEVARRYAFTDGAGEIGIIASVSQPFCGGCTRLRLSADGRLYTCLFAREGMDLRPLVRGDKAPDAIEKAIQSLWRQRADRYSELRDTFGHRIPKVEMFHIGG